MMQPTQQIASHSLPSSRNGLKGSRQREDLIYQIVTVAAILLVLGSLWLF